MEQGSSSVQITAFSPLFAVPLVTVFAGVGRSWRATTRSGQNTKGIALKRNLLPVVVSMSVFYNRLDYGTPTKQLLARTTCEKYVQFGGVFT